MEIWAASRIYNTSGGGLIHSFAGDQLQTQLGEYGKGVNCIDITACLRSLNRNPRPTLEGLFDDYHEYLKTLPKITFRRKLKRVEIEFLSDHFNADDIEERRPSVENLQIAAGEIAEVLLLLKKRIKPTDDFDVTRFLADAAKALSTTPGTVSEWDGVRERAKHIRKAIYTATDPWERLEIDWDRFHPRAREILDDPFFWECANDLSPNGNDTGADVLEDFQRWNKRNGEGSPLRFLEEVFKGWDIEPIDWLITDERDVHELDRQAPISLRVCNEAAIGVAFAVIKLRASCPSELFEMAICALERTSLLVKASELSEEVKSEWKEAIAKMRAKLLSLASGEEADE